VSVVYGTTSDVAGAAIQNFRIGPSLSNRIGTSDSNLNLEALQVPSLSGQKCGNTAPKTVKICNFANKFALKGRLVCKHL